MKFSKAATDAAISTTTTPTLHSITLGSGPSAPTVSFPSFPSADDDPLLKKIALRSALAAVAPHVASVPSRAIFDAFAQALPFDIHAIDTECVGLCNTIRSAFTKPGHPAISMQAIDFLNVRGYSVPVKLYLH